MREWSAWAKSARQKIDRAASQVIMTPGSMRPMSEDEQAVAEILHSRGSTSDNDLAIVIVRKLATNLAMRTLVPPPTTGVMNPLCQCQQPVPYDSPFGKACRNCKRFIVP